MEANLPTPNQAAPQAHTKINDTCLPKCGDDEPIFVLRAQDASADEVVQKWIDLNVETLGYEHPKIKAAIATRDAMAAWPSRKTAD
jgi:hypothetical protein